MARERRQRIPKKDTQTITEPIRKRGRPKKTQSVGLGDTIEKITEATGIKKVVESLTDDCGCEERKAKLNKLFQYKLKVVNCPNDEEREWYTEFYKNRTLTINNEDRKKICKLYANTFNLPYFEPCVGCSPKPYLAMINKLDKIFGYN